MTGRLDPEGAEQEALLDLVDLQGKRILEVGCGDGRLTWLLAAMASHVTAIDPDSEAIATAREECPPELEARVDFMDLSIEEYENRHGDERFDLALFSWSL
jgi:2-polyprenyl-3-methyl-5-hydroxy-6-metoxy-1,4-benzoquinol methylase